MPAEDLDRLRARAAKLDLGDKALQVNEEILDIVPDDMAAATLVGRCLEHLGRNEEALEHWELIVQLQPHNSIAPNRLKTLKYHMSTPPKEPKVVPSKWPKRAPEKIVEPNIKRPGRLACLQFLARSIQMIEKIDSSRLAVTDRPSDGRFRVSGGKGSGVTPWEGLLCVFVHGPQVTPETEAAIEHAGGRVVFAAGGLKSLPESVEYGVPYANVADVADLLAAPHREHLLRSLEAGPAPWGRRHDRALRDYIVTQANSD